MRGTFLWSNPANVAALPNIQFWWDASSPSYFVPTNPSDGTNLSNWNSKVAGGRNAAPVSGSAKPKFYTPIQNGLGATGYASPQAFNTPLNTALEGISGYTAFIAYKFTNTNTSQMLIDTSGHDVSFGINSSGIGIYAAAGGSATGTAADTLWHVRSIKFDGSQPVGNRISSKKDGTPIPLTVTTNPGTVSSSSNATLYLAQDRNASNYFTGYIGEVIVCTVALSPGDEQAILTYMLGKWGL